MLAKSSLTVIGYPKLGRASAGDAWPCIYRPAGRRKIAAWMGGRIPGGSCPAGSAGFWVPEWKVIE